MKTASTSLEVSNTVRPIPIPIENTATGNMCSGSVQALSNPIGLDGGFGRGVSIEE
jgi:hypothetical protein